MKFYLTALFVLLCMAFIVSCSNDSDQKKSSAITENPTDGKWQDMNESPLKFERILTIGNDSDLILPGSYDITGPVADNAGNIYFIDEQNGKMYSFDPQGNLRWKKGNPGKGPGDFQDPQGLVTDGTYLYTANIQGSRIDQFDSNGNLVHSSNLEQFDLTFTAVEEFISDTLLVTGSVTWGQIGRKITIFNTTDTLRLVSQFDVFTSPKFELPQGFAHSLAISVVDSFITAGNVGNYKVSFYNLEGEMRKTINRDFKKLVPPATYKSGSSRSMGSYSGLNAPTDLKNDYFFTTLHWPTNIEDPDQFLKQAVENRENAKKANYHNAIDLYRSDGTLLYTIENEGRNLNMGTITYVDSEGNIYAKSDLPFPQIRKYRVQISSPGSQQSEMDDVLGSIN